MELIDDLLSLAGGKTVEVDDLETKTSLLPVLERVIESFSPEVDAKSARLRYLPVDQEVYVRGTEDGLEKIFNNLVSNAVKYSPQEGQIVVRVTLEGKWALVSVSDNGIGIPEAEQPALFEEFYRASNARKAQINGTGLGLSIVKQYVERFGGSVEVCSQEGRGSVFTVSLVVGQAQDVAGDGD